jgi:NCAIR mutase (PurE)-related protein
MDPDRLRKLLDDVKSGEVQVEDAMRALRDLPFADLGYATIDHHRALRVGFPEVVFGTGKTPEQIVGIVREIGARGQAVLVTRVSESAATALRAAIPEVVHDALSRTCVLAPAAPAKIAELPICVVTAGTSDLPVAEEAAVTARVMGNEVTRLTDVGVAGIHRLLARRAELDRAGVVIVVAGMEGALASVVGGLVDKPVIAVPTSVGYGASFDGLAALLTMLNSCAAGVTVVNIDNGFGAAYSASLINRGGLRPPPPPDSRGS